MNYTTTAPQVGSSPSSCSPGWRTIHIVHVVSHSVGRQIFEDEDKQKALARAIEFAAALCESETSAHVTIITESRVEQITNKA